MEEREHLDVADVQGVYDLIVPGGRPKEILHSMRIAREGPLEVYRVSKAVKQTEYQHYYVFLLNDYLVVFRSADEKERKKSKNEKQIFVTECLIGLKEGEKVEEDEKESSFRLVVGTTVIYFKAKDPQERAEWADDIRAATQGYYNSYPDSHKHFKEINGKRIYDPFGDLTDEQLEKVKLLKDKMEKRTPPLTEEEKGWLSDIVYVRYLRARQFNLDKSFYMLDNSIKWRDDHKHWQITAKEIENELKGGGMYVHPYARDREGRPIVYMRSRLFTDDDAAKLPLFAWVLEKACNMMKTEETGIYKMTWIIDLGNTPFEMGRMGDHAKLGKAIITTLQDNYPERLGVVFLVDPPGLFSTLWSLIRPFVDPITRKKVVFVKDKEDRKKLRGYFDDEQLEEEYGGKDKFKFVYTPDIDEKYEQNKWL